MLHLLLIYKNELRAAPSNRQGAGEVPSTRATVPGVTVLYCRIHLHKARDSELVSGKKEKERTGWS